MAGSNAARGLIGQWMVGSAQFSEIEAGVVDGQLMPLAGVVGGELAGITMPLGGVILGMSVGSEASAAFTVTPHINGTDADAAYDLAVTGAEQSVIYKTPLPFDAGDYIGIAYDGTVSTQKDVQATLWYALDLVNG